MSRLGTKRSAACGPAGRGSTPRRGASKSSGSENRAINDLVSDGLTRAERISLPITLAILVLAFGALVAASVPLLLGVTSVAAALGALDPGDPLSLTASRQAQAYARDRTELAINQFPVVTEADLPRLFTDFHRPSLR